MSHFYHIKDNIFLSNLYNANNINNLKNNNIKIVIRLSEDNNKSLYDSSILFYNYELEDNLLYKKEIIDFSKEIYDIIFKNNDKNILIHCNEGQSRSVSVIIYYLCMKYNWNYDIAYNYIKNIKSDIRPNNSFIFELKKIFDPNFKINNKKISKQDDTFDEEEYKNKCIKMLLSK